jgi:hypothetical protein
MSIRPGTTMRTRSPTITGPDEGGYGVTTAR